MRIFLEKTGEGKATYLNIPIAATIKEFFTACSHALECKPEQLIIHAIRDEQNELIGSIALGGHDEIVLFTCLKRQCKKNITQNESFELHLNYSITPLKDTLSTAHPSQSFFSQAMAPKYIVTRDQLLKQFSNQAPENNCIKGVLVTEFFELGDSHSFEQTNKDLSYKKIDPLELGLKCIRFEHLQGTAFCNNKTNLGLVFPERATPEKILQQLEYEFGAANARQFILSYSQGPVKMLPLILAGAIKSYPDSEVLITLPLIFNPEEDIEINYFSKPQDNGLTAEVFARITYKKIPVLDPNNDETLSIIGYIPGPTEVTFQICQYKKYNGCLLLDIKTNNNFVHEVLQGKLFTSSELKNRSSFCDSKIQPPNNALEVKTPTEVDIKNLKYLIYIESAMRKILTLLEQKPNSTDKKINYIPAGIRILKTLLPLREIHEGKDFFVTLLGILLLENK